MADFYNRQLLKKGKVDAFSIIKFRHPTNGAVNTAEFDFPDSINVSQPWIRETAIGDKCVSMLEEVGRWSQWRLICLYDGGSEGRPDRKKRWRMSPFSVIMGKSIGPARMMGWN